MKRFLLTLLFALATLGLSHADTTKVLIIGSDYDLGDKYGSDSAAFSPTAIASELDEILTKNGPGNATVTVEERYNHYNPTGFVYNGHTFGSRSYNLTGWFHYPLPAGAEEARWANLRGEGGTVWDYVVIIGDPYTIEKTPGMYAQGVAKVAEEVAKGADPAEVILLMNWPASASSSSVAHYKEVVYRTGRSGGYKVAPAALAWEAAGSPSGVSHPNADGAYIAAASIYSRIYNQSASNSGYTYNDTLADTVQTTVAANVGQPQYSGDFNFINPYLMLGDKRRDVHFSENGTSTEEDFKNAAKSAMDRIGVTYNTIDYCPNGSSSSATYNSNTPEDDGLGWPVGNEMPIAWNHGRSYPDGRIKLNPDYWQLGLGFEYQWNTTAYSTEIANDHYIAMMDYYDTNRANDRLADAAIGARWMPTRMLWAQFHKEYPDSNPMRDSNHLNWDQTHAIGTYMYTLYSGRCPLDPEPSPMTSVWMAQKIGYETAWRMGRCQTRAPGFKVMPSAASAKTVTPTSSDTMSVQFIMAPTHDVTVNIASSDVLKGKVSPSQLTFTPENYNVPQTVTVIGETGAAGSFEFDAQFSTTSTDPVYDGLSDTWTYTNNRTQGLSQVLGNDVVIETGDTTPDLTDGTDFGYVDASLTKVFTIFNQSATDTVNLTDSPRVTLSDASGNFTLTQDAASGAIAPLGSTTFSITYDATADLSGGLHTATVSISSSDPLLPTYTFTVQALSPGQPTVINAGSTGGQLSATLEGQLSVGSMADVIIYWGTTDGGTTPENWENAQSFTAVTEGNNFSVELTDLVAGRQYYYRVFASNSKGEAWSESTELFMTEAPVALPSTPVRWGAPAKYWSIEELSPALWLDASDASTITESGGAVSQWADKSGNNRDATQTDGSLKPTYTLSSMNGQDVLTFDGSDDHLNVDLDFLAGVSHSAFIVTNVTDYDNIYGAANGNSGSNSLHVGFSGASNYRMNYWSNDYYPAMSANFHAGQANIVNYVWTSGSDKQVFANGYSEGNSGSAGVVGTMAGGGMIGGAVGNYFGGDIAEMIIFTGDVDAETRQQIEGYLAWKWGLESNLPVDHPYKNVELRTETVNAGNSADINALPKALWLDASDASTIIESEGSVSQWNDKSGNDLHLTQATGTNQPLSGSETIGGMNGILFDGVDDVLISSSNPFGTQISDASIFFAMKPKSVSTTGVLFSLSGDPNSRWQAHMPWSDGKAYFDCGGASGTSRISGPSGLSVNQELIASFTCENATGKQEVRTNGNVLISDTTGHIVSTGGNIMLGGPVNFQNVVIGECIVINGTVSDADRTIIEGYLAWKWGLESSLPVDHPYASEPPASAEHMVTADVSMSAADSYNASTPVSPDLGVNDYYLTDITNRTPVIYGAHQAGLTIKSDATQGYAELAEEMIVGDRTKAMMIWKKADFLAERSVTLTRFKLDLFGPADLSYENRWVVEKDGQFYISDQTFTTGNQDVDASTLTWSEYTPLNGGSDTIGASATISLHDLDSIGFYVNAERTANSGDSWMRTSLYYFAVDGDEDPDLSATVNYVTYEAGPNGTITGTATQEVIYDGSTTAVTATPDTGYVFVNWDDGSTANPRSDANVTSSQTYTANFAPVASPEVVYQAGPNGSITGTTTQVVPYNGSTTEVTAVAAAYYSFSGWDDGSTANPRSDTNVTSDQTYTAIFTAVATADNAVPHAWLAAQDPSWTSGFEVLQATDHDGDGVTTGDEYWAGTDPNDKDSVLALAVSVANGVLTLEWSQHNPAAELPDLRLESSVDLGIESWGLVEAIQRTDGVMTWTKPDPLSGAGPRTFYRLVVPQN